MRLFGLLIILFSFGCGQFSRRTEVEAPAPAFVTSIQQLTFQGPRSGEGYFSADGRQMVFQAEREVGNPFYQIYLRDLEGGSTRRLSNGQGKTTCAWLHPFEPKAMFSSTHADPAWKDKAKQQLETRRSGQREKYSWSYDDKFEIYETRLNQPGTYKVLSPAPGYDAEGSYSPDGQWIAFASNRHAYQGKLSPEEVKRRDEDPSYFLEIYLMRADGTGLKRLTHAPGYDGGPFFSPDGNELVWRRFTADGKIAEVWTMKVDGTEQKQVTRMQATSWAPFFHPSGDYLIFTSNKFGYDNFELFIVDRAGKREPVRVTSRPGFDGLPVFTPDGRRLSWTQRNEKGDSQIFIGDWDDALARSSLGLKPRLSAPGLGSPQLSQSDAKDWVEFLAAPEMKGRRPGAEEEKIYTGAIADQFKRLGLKPLIKEGFRQTFQFQSGVRLKQSEANQILVRSAGSDHRWVVNQEWAPLSFSANGTFEPTEVVFAGYGIVAPASNKVAAYDSYQSLDVKGRWVMVLKDMPNNIGNEQRFHLNLYSKLQHKALVARQAGALGLIVVDPVANHLNLRFEGADAGTTSIPVVAVTAALGESLLKTSKKKLAQWRKELDGGAVQGLVLPDLKIAVSIAIEPIFSNALNVLAKLEIPGAKGMVMIGAHGDHLGLGESGNSLAKAHEQGSVHRGADDNASGVAAVMEIAQHLAYQVKTGRLKPRTNFAFAVWSAEEVGILGSTHFVNSNKESIKAYLNLDMVGRLSDSLIIQGIGSAPQWPEILEPIASTAPIAVTTQADPYLPTDAMAFYLKQIPSLSFFTGAHSEYHSPRDIPETLNYAGLIQVAGVVSRLAERLSQNEVSPTYQKVEGGRLSQQSRGFRLYLGTIPDYAQGGIKGVRISGTTKSSPAEKAGLREGDVIVELGGTKIDNIQDYVYCLQSMKANEKTPLKVLRAGAELNLEIVPALKGM